MQISKLQIKMQNYFLPLRVKMLEANMLEISSSSFKNQVVSSALDLPASCNEQTTGQNYLIFEFCIVILMFNI